MILHAILLSLLHPACSDPRTKPSATGTQGEDEASEPDSGEEGGDDEEPSDSILESLECAEACGNLRLLLRANAGSISLSLPIDMYLANTSGVANNWAGTSEGGEARATWAEDADPGICASIEEWPQVGDFSVTFDAYRVDYVPLRAWDPSEPEWSWDGTELGELTLSLTGLRLLSGETSVSGPVDLNCILTYSKPDLPAR
jgi:hypothetical protein